MRTKEELEKSMEAGSKKHAANLNLALLLLPVLDMIPTPDGVDLPQLSAEYGVSITLRGWPLEMSCGWVAELEELVRGEAKVSQAHYYGEHVTVSYTFFKETNVEFVVRNSDAKGCRWVAEEEEVEEEIIEAHTEETGGHVVCGD